MIRTRDVFVFVLLSLFLMGGITLTILMGVYGNNQSATVSEVAFNDSQLSFSATMSELYERDKSVALEEMRSKVLAYREEGESLYYLHQPDEIIIEDELLTDDAGSVNPNYCGVVRDFIQNWQVGAQILEIEGGRVVATVDGGEIQEVLLQFPQPFTPNPGAYCLPSEVVGVANDGSLIKNNEVSLYGIFSDSTVVGYALDGFPIFGKNNTVSTDVCGGTVTSRGYGYVLSNGRDTMVNCFSSAPLHF